MTAGARTRWNRLAAALLTAAALLPALHDVASHHVHGSADGASLHTAACEEGHGSSPDGCTICLATRSVQAKALRAWPYAPSTRSVAAPPALPPAPLVAGRAASGTASPRAPPSA